MLRTAGAVRRPATCRSTAARTLQPRLVRSTSASAPQAAPRPLHRCYAKERAAAPPAAEPAPETDDKEPGEPAPSEDETKKKQQVVFGPVPLSFWYTSDKAYIDENYMRLRDLYRVTTFDPAEADKLRHKEFELHLDEWKRRARLPHLTEYMKQQQTAAAEYRPLLRAALKERRQAHKDFLGSIDRKIETESKVTPDELYKLSIGEGAKTPQEMEEHLKVIAKQMLEDRFRRAGEMSQDPVVDEAMQQPLEVFEREMWLDMLPSTVMEGHSTMDNMLLADWFPSPKHLRTGEDDDIRDWHKRKDFLRSRAKLNAYGLRTHPLDDPPPAREYHRIQTAQVNKQARVVAEKLAMPEYLRLPPIPRDASLEKREQVIKLHLLVHEARRMRLASYRHELHSEETRQRLRELKAAVDDPIGLQAFLEATPLENNYQIAALLIQMEHAQSLVANRDTLKREDLITFEEAVGILRRVVQDRNIPFTLIPPPVKPGEESIFDEDELTNGTVAGDAATPSGKQPAYDVFATPKEKALLEELRSGDGTEVAYKPASDAPAADATNAKSQPPTPPADVAATPSSDAPAASTGADPKRIDEAKKGIAEPPQTPKPKREPLPALPRVSLTQKLSPEEVEKLEQVLANLMSSLIGVQEIRQLEQGEIQVMTSADEYIEELRNMLSAYAVGPRDYSFLDKEYDVEITRRYSFQPEPAGNPHVQKVKAMRCRPALRRPCGLHPRCGALNFRLQTFISPDRTARSVLWIRFWMCSTSPFTSLYRPRCGYLLLLLI